MAITTRLTAATQALSTAGLRMDSAASILQAARHHLTAAQRRPYAQVLTEAREARAAAQRAADAEYATRHDLHVAEDACPLCGNRAYDLHSEHATEEERRWAASLSDDAARMLGVSL